MGRPDPDTFRSTFALVSNWLDELPDATGVPWERTVLGGFSQGAVMTYALGLGEGRPSPAALIALSGFIPVVPGFELDLASRQGLPVAIGHGTHDPVISVEFSRQARPLLEQAGLAVVYRESPMAHGVDPGFLTRALRAGSTICSRQRQSGSRFLLPAFRLLPSNRFEHALLQHRRRRDLRQPQFQVRRPDTPHLLS